MLGGSSEPNMLFHSSLTFESCLTCFLAMKKNQNNLMEAPRANTAFITLCVRGAEEGGQHGLHALCALHEGQFIYIHI